MRRITLLARMAVFCLIVFAVEALAQESAQPATREITLLDTIKSGGITGWVIILLSVVALGLVIEHFITIRRGVLIPIRTVSHIRGLIKAGEYADLVAFCGMDRSFVSRVIAAAFVEHRSGYEEMENAMLDAGNEETAKLYRKIEYLSLIGNIAPMLGLLGTVVGMIQSFNVIAQSAGFAKPSELADGISKALVTTCMGLIVAIPILVAYVYFRNLVEKLSAESAETCDELMRPLKRKGAERNAS